MLNSAITRQILVDRLGYPSMTAHHLKVRVNNEPRSTEQYDTWCGRGGSNLPYPII